MEPPAGSAAPYRAIFEAASDGFILWDAQLTVIDANPAALQMLGYRLEQVIGRAAPQLLPDGHVQERLQLVREALAGEAVQVQTPTGTIGVRGTHFLVKVDG